MSNKIAIKKYSMHGVKWWDKKLIKQILKIGVPLIISTLVFSLTDVVDNISLGVWAKKGSIAIATYAGRLYWISLLIVFMFPTSFGFLVAQYFGAKQYDNEKKAIAISMALSTIFSIISLIIIFVFGKQIISLFVKNDENFNYYVNNAYEYAKVFGFLIIIEGIIQSFALGIVAEGKTKELSILMIITIPLNFLFNFIFMKVLHMDAIGCSYSTLTTFSIVVCLFFVWLIVNSRKERIHFAFNPILLIKWDKDILKKGFKKIFLGIAAVIQELSIILTMTIFSKNYSNGAIVTSMINPFFNIILFVGTGIVSTKSFFVAKNLGAGKFKKAYQNDSKINLYTLVFSIANALIVAALAYPIPLIYTKESSANKLMATYAILIIAFSYPFVVLSMALGGSLSSGGKAKEQFIAGSVQSFILEVGILWIIVSFTNISFVYLYILYRIFKSIKIFLYVFFWKQKKWITNETNVSKEIIQEVPIER